MELSWTLTRSSRVTLPRTTAPNQTLDSSCMWTVSVTWAPGATKTRGPVILRGAGACPRAQRRDPKDPLARTIQASGSFASSGWHLPTFPIRLPFLEKRRDALFEVFAHVAHQDEVIGLFEAGFVDDALHGHLGRANRERRVAGDVLGQLLGTRLESLGLDDLVEHAQREPFLSADESGGEDQLFGARRSDERHESVVVLRRQRVPERARYRHAEPHVGAGQAHVTAHGKRGAAADARATNHGDSWFLHAFEARAVLVVVALVIQRIFGRIERLELRDVGARNERFVACATQHQDAHTLVVVDVLAAGVEAFVHRPGQRIARFGSVERQVRDGATSFIEQVFGRRDELGGRRGHGTV